MEDYNPSSTEVEETPENRRRYLWGRFYESYRKLIGEKDDDDDDEEEEKKEKKSKKSSITTEEKAESNWKPERLRTKLRNIFKRTVGLELLPAEAAESDNEAESANSFNEYETLESEPQSDIESEVTEVEQGILAVSVDAQRRYGQILPESETPDEALELPEIEVDDIETDNPVERDTMPNITPVNTEQRTTSAPEPVGEVLKREQAKRSERRVKKLRRRTRNIKNEQADMKQRENKFAKQLETNLKAQEQFEKVTVPKMEADRKKLHQRLEKLSDSIKIEYPEANSVISEAPDSKVIVKTEYIQANVPNVEPAAGPEQIRPRIESFDEQDDGYRETDYERRHEVKDEPSGILAPASNSYSNFSQSYGAPTSPNYQAPDYQPPTQPSSSKLGDIYDRYTLQPGETMYRQAAVNGAVGGIVIVILLGLLMLIR